MAKGGLNIAMTQTIVIGSHKVLRDNVNDGVGADVDSAEVNKTDK